MLYRERLLTCPRCDASLGLGPGSGHDRHERWPCGLCGGVAVEAGALFRTLRRYAPEPVAHAPSSVVPLSAEASLGCAACNLPMQPLALHGIRLDRCDRDRLVWLDAHQLDVMIDAAIAVHESRKGMLRRLLDLLFAN